MLEDHVERGTARKFGFGAAGEEDGTKPGETAYAGSDSCALRLFASILNPTS